MAVLKYRVSPKLVAEVNADTPKAAFGALAGLDEIFGQGECGCCGGDDLRHLHRVAETDEGSFDYYELQCKKCFARLSFGQKKDGKNLFPKNKPDESDGRREYGKNGWYKWSNNNGSASSNGTGEEVLDEQEVPF